MKSVVRIAGMSSLESGFERMKGKIVVSSPFFILAVLFVLFDLELLLLFPGVVSTSFFLKRSSSWLILTGVIITTVVLE